MRQTIADRRLSSPNSSSPQSTCGSSDGAGGTWGLRHPAAAAATAALPGGSAIACLISLPLQGLGDLLPATGQRRDQVSQDLGVRVPLIRGRHVEARGPAAVPNAARAPNPVHVILDVAWEVVVDDVRHLGDVEAPCRDVRGHHDGGLAAAELREGDLPIALLHVAVDGHSLVLAAQQVGLQPCGRALHGDEDQRRIVGVLLQHLQQRVGLLVVRGDHEGLLDALGGRADSADADPDVVVHEGLRQFLNLLRESRREHESHPTVNRRRHVPLQHDLIDLRHEAHVEHAVRLVQDQEAHGRHGQDLAVDEVDEPPRRRRHDVRAHGELEELRLGVDAAVDLGTSDRRLEGELPRLEVDLGAELACRGEDDRLRRSRHADLHAHGARGLRGVDATEDRQQEGTRLARARLRAAHGIPPRQRHWDGMPLDRCGLRVLAPLDIVPQEVRQLELLPQVFEASDGLDALRVLA
mmetsp:Transcript_145911/g.467706  ORF Transcript_145911/g.467706 Transcript_145911/m.467706 type:complete len:467 (+) Transcript_145911:92-1492(+)